MAKKKTTRKTTKSVKAVKAPRRHKQAAKPVLVQPTFNLPKLNLPQITQNKPLLATGILAAVVLFLVAFPFRFLIVPAIVNGQPIFSWQYVAELHKKSGQQILNQMVTQKLIESEIRKQGIQVSQPEIDTQIKDIEASIGTESGGLDAVLVYQGISRDEFVGQLRTNLALEKLVKSTITISDADVTAEVKANPKIYANLSEQDAATSAAAAIRTSKLQETFTTWFQELQSKASIKNYFITPPLSFPQP